MSTTERAEFMRPRADGAEQTPWARVDEEGRIVIPAGLAARLGLTPGAEMRVELLANGLRLHRPITHLARLYIEPTTACNLLCRTCFRNAWEEPAGFMSEETFAAILDGLAQLDVVPTVHFGGIGEPLFHPRTIAWIGRVKQLGGQVELITNGTLLTEECSRALIAAGLDLLWVSIDGATPESYADVRLGAELSGVIANVSLFRKLRRGAHHPKPEIGIAFVAMKRNIGELPQVLRLGRQLGARHFMVSNVQPTTADLQEEMLCTRSMHDLAYLPSATVPRLSLPKMDMDEITRDALFQAFNSGYNVS
ncbi:MAG: radical SAM protein, partial [Anaerolineae bacterium]|nr:radical SAM protein [Anaerolineae bacterium]